MSADEHPAAPPERIRFQVETIREMGLCGGWSPDLERVCILEPAHEEPHPWDGVAGVTARDHAAAAAGMNAREHADRLALPIARERGEIETITSRMPLNAQVEYLSEVVCWEESLAALLALAEQADRMREALADERMANLRLMTSGRELVGYARALEANVMGNGLAYRRDALRHAIGMFEIQLERSAERPAALALPVAGRE